MAAPVRSLINRLFFFARFPVTKRSDKYLQEQQAAAAAAAASAHSGKDGKKKHKKSKKSKKSKNKVAYVSSSESEAGKQGYLK